MLKEIRRKVMQIANRLVKRGQVRACAMETAWRLVKAHALSTRVVGTSFDNRQNVLALMTKYSPADISVESRSRKHKTPLTAMLWLLQQP